MKRICKYCNNEFESNREWQKFCSRDHQKKYWKEVYSGRLKILKRIEKVEEKLGIE